MRQEIRTAEDIAARSRPGENGCIEWVPLRVSPRRRGVKPRYGQTIYRGRRMGAHVAAWEIANGRPATLGMVVMHSCDNPPCVNPAHLTLATHADNRHDAARKGIERRGGVWLSDADLETIIRRSLNDGASLSELAAEYDVSRQAISQIVNLKSLRAAQAYARTTNRA